MLKRLQGRGFKYEGAEFKVQGRGFFFANAVTWVFYGASNFKKSIWDPK